jgi:hypothetical protein
MNEQMNTDPVATNKDEAVLDVEVEVHRTPEVAELKDHAGGNEPDRRHVQAACNAVVAHIVSTQVTASLVELAEDLGRSCGDVAVLDRLAFLLRTRLTRDLELITRVRRGRARSEAAAC